MKAGLDGTFKPGRVSVTLLNGFTIDNVLRLVSTEVGIFATRPDGVTLFLPFTAFQHIAFAK